jgi:hypothetical protein
MARIALARGHTDEAVKHLLPIEQRQGKSTDAKKTLGDAIEQMETSHLKPPAAVLSAARRQLADLESSEPAKSKAP